MDVSHNEITDIDLNIKLDNLDSLIINNNVIDQLNKIHKNFPYISALDISNNLLVSEYELKHMYKLKELYEINFLGNPFFNQEFEIDFIAKNP